MFSIPLSLVIEIAFLRSSIFFTAVSCAAGDRFFTFLAVINRLFLSSATAREADIPCLETRASFSQCPYLVLRSAPRNRFEISRRFGIKTLFFVPFRFFRRYRLAYKRWQCA